MKESDHSMGVTVQLDSRIYAKPAIARALENLQGTLQGHVKTTAEGRLEIFLELDPSSTEPIEVTDLRWLLNRELIAVLAGEDAMARAGQLRAMFSASARMVTRAAQKQIVEIAEERAD